ncbi:MAG: efflux RND transporter periplasmic adaptor subunit [Candidatus Delongbacteria bacterium]|jgi:RND family efflux transporter MFP subunit|nr:efflux RND transporter periplasmic adaptor subunit [Candidatus Delongbacteria bacterium]
MKKIILLNLIIIMLIITSCSQKDENLSNIEEIKAVTVSAKIVELEEFREYIDITARPEGITDVEVTSEVSGKVIKVNKNIGDWVSKGEEIGVIDNKDFAIRLKQAKAGVLGAESSYDAAVVENRSSKKLYNEKHISEIEYLRSQSALKGAQASLEGSKASLEMSQKAYDNTRMLAPVSGSISNINIEIGENIFAGKPICNIVNTKQLKIKTGVSESDIIKLSKGMEVSIYHSSLESSLTGSVSGIGMKPLANSSNYPVEIIFDNPDGNILPGMVIECKILCCLINNAIIISTDNVVKELDENIVYTVVDSKAKRTVVKLGKKQKANYIVMSGLKKGDKLITSGLDRLKDGIEVKIK